MRTQRKLTGNELQTVMYARQHLRRVVNSGCHSISMAIVLDELDAIATHGTTDGKPYVEPQPEIGEGYRRAMIEDSHRKDLEVWCGEKWKKILPGFVLGYHYRVPIDRIPTDEDAMQNPRLTVMVQNRVSGEWLKASLLAVITNDATYPFCVLMNGEVDSWMRARFPYPGEIE